MSLARPASQWPHTQLSGHFDIDYQLAPPGWWAMTTTTADIIHIWHVCIMFRYARASGGWYEGHGIRVELSVRGGSVGRIRGSLLRSDAFYLAG